ncbi:XrtA-associated tyrosine autokinase [Massilia suwonensis]|uniref:non-specific protein-tyrosine kinase n=1 Tax=Massilia suwonensis TaxID=648895 RepID=A0ABW0MIF9_9BURK
MSIIEKAASRIDHSRAAAPAPVVVEHDGQSVVLETQGAAPVAEAPAAHAAAAPVAPVAPPVVQPTPAAAPAARADTSHIATPHVATPHVEAPGATPRKTAPKPGVRKVDLDLARMRDAGMVTAASGRTSLLEDFRVIKRPLLKRAFSEGAPGRPNNLIMITSSLPGEGKTYCAINLAMSIAMELDHTVLLVDADVARPSVLRTLGLPAQRGLMDILIDDKLDLSDVMLRTNVDTLSILPAGTSTPRATELLASSTMSNLVNEIAHRYPDRVIIFDSPPLLLTSEASVLASHMGQIVMVVEAQGTTQHAVKEALRQLEGCSNVNLIYNKARDIPGIEETYDYHYG